MKQRYAQEVKWGKESATEWEAEFKMNGKNYSALYTVEGTWKETEHELKQNEIPTAIKTTLAETFEGYKVEEFERLRQDFPKTIFIIIFQKTSSGAMRGGSSIKFNRSATIDVQIRDNERIAVMEKGRYRTIGWVYSIDEGRIVDR